MSRQEHTRTLADIVVHAIVTGHGRGIRLAGFHAENQLTLELGEEKLKPDFQMTFQAPTGEQFRFLVEVDNSTEPLSSNDPHRESIQRKIAFYDRYQGHWFAEWARQGRRGFAPRFRVLFFTQSAVRVRDILAEAASLASWKNRRLCYAATVQEFCGDNDALRSAIFLDHLGHWQSLISLHPGGNPHRPPVRLPEAVQQQLFI